MTDLHEETVDVGALSRGRVHLLLLLLGDLADQAHLVQRQLVLPIKFHDILKGEYSLANADLRIKSPPKMLKYIFLFLKDEIALE